MDIFPIFIWWLIITIFGLIGWPLAFSLLRFLPDRGFSVARPLALLLSGYIIWLGGSFQLLQNSVGGALVALSLVLAAGLTWRRQQSLAGDTATMLTWLKREWRYVLTVELLFHLAFVGWTLFKAYNPNIETAGGEKWMEIAFINGTLRSDYFPPQDPWLSGFGISYYYFGYVLMAMATRLTGLISTVAFNLYIPTLFAMTLIAAFGIVANLVSLHQTRSPSAIPQLPTADPTVAKNLNVNKLRLPAMVTGFVGALFVAVSGNLQGLLEVIHKRGLLTADFWIWLDIRDLNAPPAGPGDSWIPDRFIWWWRASRVLTDYTLAGHEQEVIDEFPFFSFLLGDVHPHVLALPFVLLVVALVLNMLANTSDINHQPSMLAKTGTAGNEQGKLSPVNSLKGPLESAWHVLKAATGGRLAFVIYAVCLGGLSFLNTWDFPIYLGVFGLVLVVWLIQHQPSWQAALKQSVVGIGILGLTGVILYLPFYVTFQSQARGFLPNLWNPTRLPQYFVFFGPFLVAIIGLLFVLSRKYGGWRKHAVWSMLLMVFGPILLMLALFSAMLISPAGRDYIQGLLNNPEVLQVIGSATVSSLIQESLARRLTNPWTFLFVGVLLGWVLALLVGSQQLSRKAGAPEGGLSQTRSAPLSVLVENFVLVLLLAGLGLTFAVEFIYLRDNFGIRMNTVFKFYFQAWVLLALASAFAVYYVSRNLRGFPAAAWQSAMVLLVAGSMVYPVLATADKANYFQNEPTLNGISWISEYRPGDYAAINWLRTHAADDAVVLEAPGAHYAAYQYTGRVSALTGVPTLLGWGGHQSQWRGNYDEPARREPDIDLLFNTVDLGQAQSLLDKYKIDYVFIGPLERERYGPAGLTKFAQLMKIAFQQEDVIIYERQ